MNRRNASLLASCILPLFAVVDATAEQEIRQKVVDKQDITVEDLAHSFFYHYSGSKNALDQLISKESVDKIRPDVAVHQRQMDDIRVHARKLRRLCDELQISKTGSDFAAALAGNDERERTEHRNAARRILAKLDSEDQRKLEEYLRIQFSQGYSRTTVDYSETFAFDPFPSERTNAITTRICTAATQAEGMVQQ